MYVCNVCTYVMYVCMYVCVCVCVCMYVMYVCNVCVYVNVCMYLAVDMSTQIVLLLVVGWVSVFFGPHFGFFWLPPIGGLRPWTLYFNAGSLARWCFQCQKLEPEYGRTWLVHRLDQKKPAAFFFTMVAISSVAAWWPTFGGRAAPAQTLRGCCRPLSKCWARWLH